MQGRDKSGTCSRRFVSTARLIEGGCPADLEGGLLDGNYILISVMKEGKQNVESATDPERAEICTMLCSRPSHSGSTLLIPSDLRTCQVFNIQSNIHHCDKPTTCLYNPQQQTENDTCPRPPAFVQLSCPLLPRYKYEWLATMDPATAWVTAYGRNGPRWGKETAMSLALHRKHIHLAQNSVSVSIPRWKAERSHHLVIQSKLHRSRTAPHTVHTPQIPSCATKACQVASISAGVGTPGPVAACAWVCGCGGPPVISKKL